MQTGIETWHKNLLSDEGTGVNVYDALKQVNDCVFQSQQDALKYYQDMITRHLSNERETSDRALDVLRRKIAELEHQNRMLEENYKSSAQGERQEVLQKLAAAEVRANEAENQLAMKDDEVGTLRKEIDDLRERVRVAYTEKDQQAEELQKRVVLAQSESDESKRVGEGYWKVELQRSQEENQKLAGTVRQLEAEVERCRKESEGRLATERKRITELESGIHRYESEHKEGSKKDLEEQKAEYERLLQEKEQQRLKQKNEWAEVPLRARTNR